VIRRLCVIGVGLIGGSLALALRRAGVVEEVVGAGRDDNHLGTAVALGLIDRFDTNLARAAANADMVVLAVPLGAMYSVCNAIRQDLNPDAVLTDVGSAKQAVVDVVQTTFGELPACFVPGHPIAGTERSGVEAAFADLYRGRRVILTPQPYTSRIAIRAVKAMWEDAGAVVEEMDIGHHDRILAATSHLPHMLAFALVDSLARLDERAEIFRYAAGGFLDFTRIASSDPVMWRDICLANSEAILGMMRRYSYDLDLIADAITKRDGEQLLRVFKRAKQSRDRLVV
jgi:prephenate dehydrogenase